MMMRALLLLLMFLPFRVAAQPSVIADLSSDTVDLEYSFTGEDLLLFGAIEHHVLDEASGPVNLVVVVRGPEAPVVVRRKDRVAGIWVNSDAVEFSPVPEYHALASTEPFASFVPDETDQILRFSFESAVKGVNPETDAAFVKGFIRNKRAKRLYNDESDRLRILNNQLFRAEFHFPANIPEGEYSAEIYLFEGQNIVAHYSTPLAIGKVGLSRFVYTLANEQPALYGVVAIIIALFAGWLAGWIARERAK